MNILKRNLIDFSLIVLAVISTNAQSKAHDMSNFAVIDPAYNGKKVYPEVLTEEEKTKWIYGSAELESYRLQLLMARKDSAKLNVGYPGIYHKPYMNGSFQLALSTPQKVKAVKYKTTGSGRVFINDILEKEFKKSEDFHTLNRLNETEVTIIRFEIAETKGIPALLIEEGPLQTGNNKWEWKANDSIWTYTTNFPQNKLNIPPHQLEEPTLLLAPKEKQNSLYDFGKELYGYVNIQSREKPMMVIGESETEALDIDNVVIEQTQEVIKVGEDLWRSKVPLAFRYVNIHNINPIKVSSEAIINPAQYKGAFACSDSLLTKIWMNSAYTLRLNMHDFLLDGMKRDRLPWTGDMAMSMLVNSYTFNDVELVRRSLVALGRAGIKEKDINGILDYSVWWIIAQNQFQLYYNDMNHLQKEWKRIQEALAVLQTRADKNGFLNSSEDDWVFIDWVNQEKWTALQILWWWAQKSAVQLAERMGDNDRANYWENKSGILKENLYKKVWDPEKEAWFSGRSTVGDYTRHPNFLAIVSGITPIDKSKGIMALLGDKSIKPVGTPYMAGFEMMALAQMGNIDYALNSISDYWGGMMKKGATSFWEAYDENQQDASQYAFYGRPYAKSLNHAWSSGPAAILPSQIFGLEPLEDGWKKFAIRPNLGYLKWASANVPTPYGSITIDIEGEVMKVSVPQGTKLLWKDKTYNGPLTLSEKY